MSVTSQNNKFELARHIKISNGEISFVYLFISLLFIAAHFIYHSYAEPLQYIWFLKYSVMSIFIFNVFCSIKIQGLKIFHPYLMFLGLLFLFILSRLFLDIVIEHIDFAQTSFLSTYIFDYEIQERMLLNFLISLIALQIGVSVALGSKAVNVNENNTILTDVNWVRIGLFLFYVGLPFLMYQYIQVAKEIMDKGYLAFHKGEIVYSNSFIITTFSRFSWVGFFIFLAGVPPKKQVYFNVALFILLVLTPRLLQGLRGPVMCMLLVLLWYVLYINDINLKKRYLLLFVVSMVFINSFIAFLRFDREFEIEDQMLTRFLYRQGVSIQVLGYSIKHDEDMADYSIVNMFANLHSFIDNVKGRIVGKKKLSNREMVDKYGYLGFWITELVNAKQFDRGYSNGSSYLAEYFLLGKELMQFIGSFLLGFFTIILIERGRQSRAGLLAILFILPSWLFIPRDNTFDFITDNLSNAIFAIAAISLMGLVLKQKSKLQNRIGGERV